LTAAGHVVALADAGVGAAEQLRGHGKWFTPVIWFEHRGCREQAARRLSDTLSL
jgi:hypothetical protein